EWSEEPTLRVPASDPVKEAAPVMLPPTDKVLPEERSPVTERVPRLLVMATGPLMPLPTVSELREAPTVRWPERVLPMVMAPLLAATVRTPERSWPTIKETNPPPPPPELAWRVPARSPVMWVAPMSPVDVAEPERLPETISELIEPLEIREPERLPETVTLPVVVPLVTVPERFCPTN